MRWRHLLTTGILLPLVVAALPGTGPGTGPARGATASDATPMTSVSVASANLREGSAVRHRADMRDGDDRAAFVRRLLRNGARPPDVILLQEVLGSAGTVARTLTRHPRAQRTRTRYVVAVAPRRTVQRGHCDGPRSGRYSTLRDSAILVNTSTVRAVNARGAVRTWGRWRAEGATRMGRGGYGCAEQPWVRVTVRQPGRQQRTARIMSSHVAPVDTRLKSRAIGHIAESMAAKHRRTPTDLVVVGGDLNQLPSRAGHRSLRRAGFHDAVRRLNPTGPDGVAGVQRRIDFIYTNAHARRSGFDRCYLAFHVQRDRCIAKRAVFPDAARFFRCQIRSLHHGAPADTCRRGAYRAYYSDHPILWATLQ